MHDRPTAWWLQTLQRRRSRTETTLGKAPLHFATPAAQDAAIRFFNAALRAEESGQAQAYGLAESLAASDPDLAEVLQLYGDEEGWHRELLLEFLSRLGGTVRPMGRVTRALYQVYGRAKRMESIVLTNLMFETIGSTTYRMALRNVQDEEARKMLTILTRDEAFHVPLNVHFLRRVLVGKSAADRLRLFVLYRLVFVSLLLLPLASRPKAGAFDDLSVAELSRGYGRELARVFSSAPDLGLPPPWLLLPLIGVGPADAAKAHSPTSARAAEAAADRSHLQVSAL
ncbi:MAG TPA: ferritin-like domain-containing protein [Polyangiaceae bacterium]|nr:ferritin-like domain-containing protein [Polyangiaceae bacterium]